MLKSLEKEVFLNVNYFYFISVGHSKIYTDKKSRKKY